MNLCEPTISNPDLEYPEVAYEPWSDLRKRDDIKHFNLSFPFQQIPIHYQKEIKKHYYAAVSYVDHQIGKLIREMESLKLMENSVVVLVGDHGWTLGHESDIKF